MKTNSISPNIQGEDGPIGLEKEFYEGLWCPSCYPTCYRTIYSFAGSDNKLTALPSKYNLSNDTDINTITLVKIFMSSGQTKLYLVSSLYKWSDIISIFGGILSISFGFSVISLMELVYFATFRMMKLYFDEEKKSKQEGNEKQIRQATNYKQMEQELMKVIEENEIKERLLYQIDKENNLN